MELGRGAHPAQMGNSRWSLQLAVQTGFRSSFSDAVSDSLELASDMIVFFVRFVIVMLPVLFVVLPSGLVLRYGTRGEADAFSRGAGNSECRVKFSRRSALR